MPTTTDSEYAALVATYGPGLSLQDMRYKKYGGPSSPVKSETDLEYAYWGSGTSLSLSDKQLANLQTATGKTGSISDLVSSYFAAGSGPLVTIAQLFATNPFYVGHRGSGDVWPEHSQPAYQGAVDAGLKALEMSIQRNANGTWFHLHDAGATGLNRTTDRTGDPSLLTDAQLATTHVVQPQLGPYWANPANYPLVPKWWDMMALYYNKVVIFLESKDYTPSVIDDMLAQLQSRYPGFQQSVIFKTHVGNVSGAVKARAVGMKVWMYIDDPLVTAQLDTAVANADYIGVNVSTYVTDPGQLTDAEISTVVARGKPVIQWSSPSRTTRNRTNALGVQGFVSSQAPYTQNNLPNRGRDFFANLAVAPGDIAYDTSRQFTLLAPGVAHFGQTTSNPAVCMGSLSPAGNLFTLDLDARFVTLPTDLTTHFGVAFSKIDDSRWQFQAANNPTPGYHFIMRANNQFALYKHLANTVSGTVLAGPATTDNPVAGQWMHFQIQVTATQVIAKRTDGAAPANLTISDTTYRGNYFYISRNYPNSVADGAGTVEFRNIVVVQN